MNSNEKKLRILSERLSSEEEIIAKKLGSSILTLPGIFIMEATKTYDLAFKATDKKFKPSFATFVTYSLKHNGVWNRNDVPDSIVVQVRFKNIQNPDKIENPREWKIYFDKSIDQKKGWFNFRLMDSKTDNIKYAFQIVKSAYDSF